MKGTPAPRGSAPGRLAPSGPDHRAGFARLRSCARGSYPVKPLPRGLTAYEPLSTAPTASSPTGAPTWGSSGSRRRRSSASWLGQGLHLKRPRRAGTSARRPFPEWATYRKNPIWIYDCTHFARCRTASAVAIMDLVTRKWLVTVVSGEETSPDPGGVQQTTPGLHRYLPPGRSPTGSMVVSFVLAESTWA
jgi:hypothetical protein